MNRETGVIQDAIAFLLDGNRDLVEGAPQCAISGCLRRLSKTVSGIQRALVHVERVSQGRHEHGSFRLERSGPQCCHP